jgi:hypothetical protein
MSLEIFVVLVASSHLPSVPADRVMRTDLRALHAKEKEMDRIIARWSKVMLALTALVCPAGNVWADSPHFINSQTTATLAQNGDLVVSWKEAGLGDNVLINYEASADANATCTCLSRSGNCPAAANKVTVSGPVSAMGAFNSGKNGTISKSLDVSPPPCPSSAPPTCGRGQTLVLSAVTYTNITLEDVTNGISASGLPSSLAKTFFTCP